MVEISDWNWSVTKGGQSRTVPYEQDIRATIQGLGGSGALIYPTYANNGNLSNAFFPNAAPSQSDFATWIGDLRTLSGLGTQTQEHDVDGARTPSTSPVSVSPMLSSEGRSRFLHRPSGLPRVTDDDEA